MTLMFPKLLEDKVIDELAFCKGNPSIKEVEEIAFICAEVGVTFRMYSPFFNMFTNKAHLHYLRYRNATTYT